MLKKESLVTGLLLLSLLILLLGFGQVVSAQTPQPLASSETAEGGETPSGDKLAPSITRVPEGTVFTRTPEPTATPGLIVRGVSKATERSRLAGESFLGLPVEDWISLGIALLIVLAGYLVGTWLIRRVLPRIVQRSDTKLDDHLLQSIGPTSGGWWWSSLSSLPSSS